MTRRLLLISSLFALATPALARELVVASEGASLRASCGAPAALATLPEGHRVTLRFSFAGADARCYSVRTELDGAQLTGYVDRAALAGLETLEQERRAASASQLAHTAVESIRIEPPRPRSDPGAPAPSTASQQSIQAAIDAFQAGRANEVEQLLRDVPRDNLLAAVLRGSAFLRLTRPGEAQAAIDPALRAHPDDPGLLGLAGVAAFQQDRTEDAKRLLERSVRARPNPALEKLLARIRTEQAADQSDDKAFGSRFVLRYDGKALPQAQARALARELDRELPAISARLGCQIRDRLTVVVQTMKDYRAGAGPTTWSGGHYDGRIHIALGADGNLDDHVRETARHEMVHACLARRGEWPVWFQEGVAEYVSGRRLAAHERQRLAGLNREGNLPELQQLMGSWARLDAATAQTAYTLALAAAQVLYQDEGDYGVRNLLSNPARLPATMTKLDERLRQTLR